MHKIRTLLSLIVALGFNSGFANDTTSLENSVENPNYIKEPEKRKFAEETTFTIMAHEPNYVLPFYYNVKPARAIYNSFDPERSDYKKPEVKFQLSLKVPLFQNIFQGRSSLFFAYTQMSYWQLYYSSPFFRESNYKPELFLSTTFNYDVGPLTLDAVDVGFVHQSNGRGTIAQRGWDRVFAKAKFVKDNFLLTAKPWVVINRNNNNADITRYLGHYELVGSYRWGNNTFSLMSRNNLESGFKRGATELTWSFPLLNNVRGYVQYFYGYGQNLLEYNHRSNSIGVGFSFADWQ